uniref:non-specific serine/threonine protein kinase n=1 Tax=Heterorhabditis bacteriophora TaxID=37862 RepID=A0A1I7WFU3_HETBA
MMIGETPFYAEALVSTYTNIMNHKNSLRFPDEPRISNHAQDLIRHFLASADVRLGNDGVDRIRAHPFFKNDEWTFESLRHATPPVIPELNGDDDTTHFEAIFSNLFDIEARETNEPFQLPKTFNGNQLPFIGFTYSNELSPITELQRNIKKSGTEQNAESSSAIEKVAVEIVDTRLKELEQLLESAKHEVMEYQGRVESNIGDSQRKEERIRQLESERDRFSERLRAAESEVREAQDRIRLCSESEERARRVEQELRIQRDALKTLEAKLGKAKEEETIMRNELRQLHTDLAQEKEVGRRQALTVAHLMNEKKMVFIRKQVDQCKKQLESERLARQIAEANLSECDKERTMLKEEVKQLVQRHEKEIQAKDQQISIMANREVELEHSMSMSQLNERATDDEISARLEDLKKSLDSRDGILPSISDFAMDGWVSMRPEKRGIGSRKIKVSFLVFIIFRSYFNYIKLSNLCHVRYVTAADVRFADNEQISKIFHVMFDGRDSSTGPTSRHASTSDLSISSLSQRGDVNFKYLYRYNSNLLDGSCFDNG